MSFLRQRKLSQRSLSPLSYKSRSSSLKDLPKYTANVTYKNLYPPLQQFVHMVNDDQQPGTSASPVNIPPPPQPSDDPNDERLARSMILTQLQIQEKIAAATHNWANDTKGKGITRKDQTTAVTKAIEEVTADIFRSNLYKDRLESDRYRRLEKELQDCLTDKDQQLTRQLQQTHLNPPASNAHIQPNNSQLATQPMQTDQPHTPPPVSMVTAPSSRQATPPVEDDAIFDHL